MLRSTSPHSRIRFLTIGFLAIMAVFVGRLFYMQIIEHDKYVQLAQRSQVKSLTIPAARGEIYAIDDGQPVQLVLNQEVYTVFVDPTEVDKPSEVVAAVREIAGGTARKDIDKLVLMTPYRYQVLATDVSRQQAQLLKAKNLHGLGFQKTSKRVYPEGKLASQVLGFVNTEDKGQYGIEEALNVELAGKDGKLVSVTDISNVPLTIGNHNIDQPAQNGKNIVLTIDRNIQSITESSLAKDMSKLGIKNATAVVMDPQTGKVLAMTSLPNYNPGEYNKVRDARRFNNEAITAPYEPGSVMKTFTLATAINEGKVEPDSTYNNTDYIQVDDRTIENASKGQTGVISMQHAFTWSLNTGLVTVAERLGNGKEITQKARQTMYSYLHDRFHLGESTGIPLSGETQGRIVPPSSPQGNAVRYSNMSFGQGMDLTMLQVSAGFCSIVNGGRYYQPSIVGGYVDADGNYTPVAAPQPTGNPISEATSRKMRKMLVTARGAFYASRDLPGYEIGGKTGTSQTLIKGSYDNGQTTGTYIGFGGDSSAKYVIMIRAETPGQAVEGSTVSLIFTDISNALIRYMNLAKRR